LRAEEAPTTAAAVYGEYLRDEVAGQEARKSSFEQRGITVVTTAGTLVTLLFGLAALSTTTTKNLGAAERAWLAGALGCFVIAAAFALATNFPRKYSGPEASDIETHLEADEEVETAQQVVALTRVELLTVAQAKNTGKGTLLFWALAFELVAVLCVGIAIVEVIHPY
jgi:uncharacterized membrane protein